MSINLILEEIKNEPKSIIPILTTLNNDRDILSNISKSNLQHLVSRVNNLIKSPNAYIKWCGINIVKVIVKDFNILASYGTLFLTNLISVLENYNRTINVKILTNCIQVVNFIMDQIRGKPTLTRNILTPKLASIINHYLQFIQYEPSLVIKSLKKLIKHHSTTFRPFGNKFQNKLISIINEPNFVNYSDALKVEIFNILALLPVIEKNEPENKWNSNLKNVIGEIIEIVEVYQEFLNFRDDQDLINLIKKMPKADTKILQDLSIDFNEPDSIFQLSNNLNILLTLLSSQVTMETSYTVSVPIGLIVTLCEIICTINLKFLSFKSDIRDDEIKSIIKLTLIENYKSVLNLLDKLLLYQGHLLPHFNSILSFLEILIPMKSNKLDVNEILSFESLYVGLLQTIMQYLHLIGIYSDNSIILKFVDVALLLVEPRIKKEEDAKPQQSSQKAKKKKNTSSVTLSDILSHQHLFKQSIPKTTLSIVRSFINQIILKFELPPTQHYKIMRYLITEAIHSQYYNLEHNVPNELKQLLLNAVLYPGYEKNSILPIISTILKDDNLLSVFNNPRFPPLPKLINLSTDNVQQSEDKEEEKMKIQTMNENPMKKRKLETEIKPLEEPTAIEVEDDEEEEEEEDNSAQIFSKTIQIEQLETVESPKQLEVVEETKQIYPNSTTIVKTSVATKEESDDDSGSDFEMPEINVDSDDDDDEDQ
ncbi:unnamed protein product [Candida verbasci]|uniref:Pre-rRNA-processing protein RIX1 n=1 Tax=Candida verbasci TaxID=1227364 RepID=A0A9W4XBA5_9ASCO|nr:unnamed protein product [Candida verbasci]